MFNEEKKLGKQIVKGVATGCLKGLLSSTPYVGTSIVGVWDECWNSRIQDAITKLSEALDKIEEQKIDQEFIRSEEFIDLFYKAIRIRVQSRSKQKAKFIQGLLIESMQKNRDARFSISLKESFLSILDQLTEEEIQFLYDFSADKYFRKSKDDIYGMGDHYAIALDGLFSRGILREKSSWDQYVRESMLGREFIEYTKILASNP